MINKIVTNDIYGNTHIYRNFSKPHTFSEKVTCKCSKCGRTITKSFSFEYYDEPTQEQFNKLREREQEWLSNEHVCNKCYKEACKGEQSPLDMKPIEMELSIVAYAQHEMELREKAIHQHMSIISDKLKGKVCLYEGKEYVIREAGFCEKFYIWGYKVDERYPWTTTDKDICITEAGCGFGRGVNAKFSEVQFTDEIFEDRKKRVEELEE